MPYEVVTKDGVTIRAVTAQDAITLAKAIAEEAAADERRARRARGSQAKDADRTGSAETPRDSARSETEPLFEEDAPHAGTNGTGPGHAGGQWTPPPVVAPVFKELDDPLRRALHAIATAPPGGGISLSNLAKVMGAPTNRAASLTLLKCDRIAKRHNLDWRQIVQFRIVGAREKRTSVYTPGPLLRGEGGAP